MPAVRQQILIDAPARTVWSALTTAEGAAGWWASQARIDGREGGRVVLTHETPDGPVEEWGIVHKYRPTASFELRWDSTGSSPMRGMAVAFQIGRAGGETKVHVVQSGGASLDDEAFCQALDELWKSRLLRLRTLLEGP